MDEKINSTKMEEKKTLAFKLTKQNLKMSKSTQKENHFYY